MFKNCSSICNINVVETETALPVEYSRDLTFRMSIKPVHSAQVNNVRFIQGDNSHSQLYTIMLYSMDINFIQSDIGPCRVYGNVQGKKFLMPII